jgi:hypothetical protein
MSHFTTVHTKIRDPDCLMRAMEKVKPGWVGKIERHRDPQHLRGFQNDQREQMAHIIVRRRHVGQASNDLGFLRQPDGSYGIHISDHDAGHNGYTNDWVSQLTRTYAEEKVMRALKARGMQFNTQKTKDATTIKVLV